MRGETTRLTVLAAAAVSFAVSLALGPIAFPNFTGNNDEPVYVFQAKALAEGQLSVDAELHSGPFRPWLTGEHDGQVFTQYQPGWPLFLAGAERLGNMRMAIAASASLLVIANAAFAEALYQRKRVTQVTALLTAATPLFVVHSFTYLPYLFSAALLVGASAIAVAGFRFDRPKWVGGAVVILSAGLLVRPFDAVLVGLLWMIGLVLYSGEGSALTRIRKFAPIAALAGLPMVVLTVLFNRRITGHFFEFPISATAAENRFGFGDRAILDGEPPVNYSLDAARESLFSGIAAVPSWIPFGLVGLVCVGFALASRNLATRTKISLVAAVLIFPIGYFFWWATTLAREGLVNGLGPHYYLPGFVVLVNLIAYGLVVMCSRLKRRELTVALVVLGTALTIYNWDDKVADINLTSALHERDAEAQLPTEPALVFLPSDQQFVLFKRPFLANSPTRDDGVRFAIDDDHLNLEARASSAAPPFRLENVWYPDDDLLQPTVEYTPIDYLSGPQICVRVVDPLQGALFEGLDNQRRRPIGPSVTIESPVTNRLSLMFVAADDPSVASRVTLRMGNLGGDEVEVEIPGTVEKLVVLPQGELWLIAPAADIWPVIMSVGACPDDQ